MQTRTLGSTDLRVSALGLGTVELGIPYGIGRPPPPDDRLCLRLLHRARDQGVTYIDTAPAYGRSEELVGRAFPGGRDVVVATKVSLRDDSGALLAPQLLSRAIGDSVDRSRRRLSVETLDLLQIHNLGEGELSEALLAAMAEQVEAGRVRHWGVSTYGRLAPREALRHRRSIDALQVAYSILDRTLEEEILPRCREQDVGLVVRSVFLQGVLSARRRDLGPRLEPLRRAADAAGRVADGLGIGLPGLALRFALHESRAHVTLVGTAHPDELDANLRALEAGPLSSDTVAQLRRIHVEDESLLNPGTWNPLPEGPNQCRIHPR